MSRAKNLANLIGGASAGTSGMALPSGTTAQRPSSATAGTIRNNTSSGLLEFYTGTEWKPVGSVYDTDSTSTGYFDLPTGTTAQRPASPSAGMQRFNSTFGYIEWYDPTGTTWRPIYQAPTVSIEYLVVAGGGGGGYNRGAGGGGGGLLSGITTLTPSTSYTLIIGAGGAGGASGSASTSGSNSTFATFVAIGGGRGGDDGDGASGTGGNGGSGGGAAAWNSTSAGTGTVGQGNNGGGTAGFNGPYYGGGGGGGAGGTGLAGTTTAGGAGGVGLSNSITGSSVFYAGGGGGGSYASSNTGGAGGNGGGGNAGSYSGTGVGVAGTINRGGGGGGGCNGSGYSYNGGNGGSGVIILKIPTGYSATFTAGITFTTDTATVPGFSIYRCTAGTGTVLFN